MKKTFKQIEANSAEVSQLEKNVKKIMGAPSSESE